MAHRKTEELQHLLVILSTRLTSANVRLTVTSHRLNISGDRIPKHNYCIHPQQIPVHDHRQQLYKREIYIPNHIAGRTLSLICLSVSTHNQIY